MKKLGLFILLGLILSIGIVYAAPELPDLALDNARCFNGKLDFTVINHGGPLPAGWLAVANVYFDGTKMGHIDLNHPTSRTGGGIEVKNGTSRYLVSFAITKTVIVDIFIDSTNNIVESNESNNYSKGAQIRPCDGSAVIKPVLTQRVPANILIKRRLPDLVIKDIRMDRKCYISVKVANAGPGPVPASVWALPHHPDDSAVYLYRGGANWGGATIWKFDPAKSLQPSGGTAVYKSNLRVSGLESITAVIDGTNKVSEENENNNKRTERFRCGEETPTDPGQERKAVWRIPYAATSLSCYKPAKPGIPGVYKIKFQFKALPTTLPAGHLLVSIKYVSSIETKIFPPRNISAMTVGWSNGESRIISWGIGGDDKVELVKINKKDFVIKRDNCIIDSGVSGDIKFHLTAQSKDASGIYHTEHKMLILKQCRPVLTHRPIR